MEFGRLTRVARVRGVDVYIHWTVFVIVTLLAAKAPRGLATTLAGLAAYLGLLILHESGHIVAARRRGCEASRMALYPFVGLAFYEDPGNRFDRALIAWGGVIAQAALALPLVAITSAFGYGPFAPLKAVLVVLGDYSLLVAAFNLLPIRPLDGSRAWTIIPAYLERRRERKNRRQMAWRSPR